MIIRRENDIQKQGDESRIREARYNKKYKELGLVVSKPRYLCEENLERLWIGEEIIALIRTRCDNIEKITSIEEDNKY